MLPLLFPLFVIRSKNTLPAHKVILGTLSEPSPLLSRDVERGRGIMALDLRCSSCDSDNIQRLSVMRGSGNRRRNNRQRANISGWVVKRAK